VRDPNIQRKTKLQCSWNLPFKKFMENSQASKEAKQQPQSFTLRVTSLNPMPNAQVCVYLTVHITKLQLQTTFPKPLYIPHSACIHRDSSGPWLLKILMFALLVTPEIASYWWVNFFHLVLIIV
jgi:hypothetical protein